MKPDEATIQTEADIQTAVEFTPTITNVALDSQLLSTVMACARLGDFRFNHNFQSIGGKSNSLEVGSIIHRYAEIYYDALSRGMEKDKAHQLGIAAAEHYIQGCPDCIAGKCENHKKEKFLGVTNTPAEDEKNKTGWKWALETCDQYYNHYKDDHWVPCWTERVVSKQIYKDDEIRILWKAKIDLLVDTNQGILPVDHKTMKQNREVITLNSQFMGQTVVQGTSTMIVNKIGLQKTLPANEKFIRVPVSYNADVINEWVTEIVPYYAHMMIHYAKSGYWPPNFTHCESKYGKCAFYDVCRSMPDMRETELRHAFIIGEPWNPKNDEGE